MKIEGGIDFALKNGLSGPSGPDAAGGTGGATGAPGGVTEPGAAPGPDFASILERSVEGVNRLQKAATASADAFARGASDDLHGTMITMKEADISMKLVGTVRNRLLDAFHELWRINL